MKNKIFIGFAFLWFMVNSSICIASNALTAPYGFVIDQETATTTSFRISWSDSNDVDPDSLSLRYIVSSDTTLVKYLTVGNNNDLITGLSPRTTYIMLLTNVRGDSCASSTKDTVTTISPKIESGNVTKSNMISLNGARYDTRFNTALWDTFYVSTSAGLDSSQVYWVGEYTALQAELIGNADSCKVNLLVFSGNATTSEWGFENVAEDSVIATKAGWTTPKQLVIHPTNHMYVRLDGQTDNGNATKVRLKLFRYGEIAKP